MYRVPGWIGVVLVMFALCTDVAWSQFIPAGARSTNRRRPEPSQSTGALRAEFVRTLDNFREAISDYGNALSQDEPLEKKVKEVQKHIGSLENYLKLNDVKTPQFDQAEFDDFSTRELKWETLTTAERTDNDLRLVLRVMDKAERDNMVTIQALQFFREVQGDLRRLKWLTSKVADLSRQEQSTRK